MSDELDGTVCPFCHEGDFDFIGLKYHLTSGHCEEYEKTPLPRSMMFQSEMRKLTDHAKYLNSVADMLNGYAGEALRAAAHYITHIESELNIAATELRRLQAENEKLLALAKFGKECFVEHRSVIGAIDGGWLQDKCESLGLITPINVSEACDPEYCSCAEMGEWPQECYRPTPLAQLPEGIE